jgi:thiamine-monophosphate kinase
MNILDRTVVEIGERGVVREILNVLGHQPCLVDGLGHDAGFVDLDISSDELLLTNTDRSGVNLAYTLGLANGECVGDFGISHAISDIVASGGDPKICTIALLLPRECKLGFVLEVMKGAKHAASRYGAVIASGDTKANPKFAMVVTAIGTTQRKRRLLRSGARHGDLLAVTGHLGTMLAGTLAFRRGLPLDEKLHYLLRQSIVEQRPPFKLGRALADAELPCACMDISDGLSGTIHAICRASSVGASIDESKIPVVPDVMYFAESLGLSRLQLSLAGGDWQYLYALPPSAMDQAMDIARKSGTGLTVIGEFSGRHDDLFISTIHYGKKRLSLVEHDSFADTDSRDHFDRLGVPLVCFSEL